MQQMARIISFRYIAMYLMALFFVKANAQDPRYPAEIIVSQDGNGNYKTIQEAVNSVRDLGEKEIRIFVKSGIYQEKLVIPSWKTNISIIGENREKTIITFNDYSGKINLNKDASGNAKISTYTSYSVLVQGNDCRLENLTIINGSGRVGQAVALHVEGDRFVAQNCSFLGNQDTLYAATERSRQYYVNCYIEGTTDFIFGQATAIFQQCEIKSLSDSYVTAAATSKNQKFGFVFFDCKLVADQSVKKVYLGRPWRTFARTVFIRCNLGKHILPEGWNPWKGDKMFPDKEKTTFYAEYKSTGEGASPATRLSWSKQLSDREVRNYAVKNILSGTDHWNPTIKN